MSFWSDITLRVRALFRRDSLEASMNEELRFHYQKQVERNVARGMSQQEARRQARLAMGGEDAIAEDCRDARGIGGIEVAAQDARFALRLLRKNPGFTLAAIVTLALGIGATTAVFSVMDSVMLRPLPYRDSGRLVTIWEHNFDGKRPTNPVAPPNFLDWQKRNSIFEAMGYSADGTVNLTGDGEPQQAVIGYVSANFFSLLGVNAALGQTFTEANGVKGKDDVVVLSYGLWQSRYAGDPAIVGRTIRVNGTPCVVLGVAPRDFDWYLRRWSMAGSHPQLFTPFILPAQASDRGKTGRYLAAFGRLKPGVTYAAAQRRMSDIAEGLAREYPDYNKRWGVLVVPLREELSGEFRPAILTLFGAVVLVLFIACANVSGLLLARAATREREMAIRSAIGASRARLARQLLTESFVLALVGGSAGFALAIWGTNALLAASPANMLDVKRVSLDPRLLAFALGSTVLATVIFGFLPSWLAAHTPLAETMKEESGTVSGNRSRGRLRSLLVVGQICLAMLLLAGSGLLTRSFVRLSGVDPGFRSERLLAFTLTLPSSSYKDDAARQHFFSDLLRRLSRLPGVRAVTMDNFPPLEGPGPGTAVHILGHPLLSLNDLPDTGVRTVGPDYFDTIGIRLVAGRGFTQEEMNTARHVVVVNETFVKTMMAGEEPIGKRAVIYMKSLDEAGNVPSEIVGVVADVHQTALGVAPEAMAYWPMPELPYGRMSILMRTTADPMSLVPASRRVLHEIDAGLPMARVATMDQLLSDSLARARFMMFLLVVFAAIALCLTAVGIYGVIAYGVAQRTHEIGIRMALGAQRGTVLGMILSEGTKLMMMGIAAGVIATLAATRLLQKLLFGVSPTDPSTLASVCALLALVALIACLIPARQATRVTPTKALRS
jgi:putative ABC transport system permease protein